MVGDVDQSIYSISAWQIIQFLLDFQHDFGDGLADEDTRTMIKIEGKLSVAGKYSGSQRIRLIENNTQRIDKILKPTRGLGEEIYWYEAEIELEEAEFVCSENSGNYRPKPRVRFRELFAVLSKIGLILSHALLGRSFDSL